VAFACPYCDHRIHLKGAKPGRFRPKCPRCDRAFALTVPEAPGAEFEVRALGSDTKESGRTVDTHCVNAARRPRQPAAVAAPAPEPVAVAAAPNSHLFEFAQTNPDLRGSSPQPKPAPVPPPAPEPPAKAPPALPRTEIRGYRVERELGRGGMGKVYLARQLSLDRPVALKVMNKRWADDPTFVARFTREAFAAAQLSHPNIVHIHDIGEVDGSRFFSMEYVRGRSLADVVRTGNKLDPETAVGYVLQAARGLKHAHDRGMIHRDVKPDNLLLDDQGLVKVADLGLVKTPATTPSDDALSGPQSGLHALPSNVTGAKIALGTPAYMSPEQCRDAAKVDRRADIYSLGCTLYVLVTGRPPFEGTTAVELMTKQAYEPLVPPERIVARLPSEISAVIQKMMAKDPADRFQTMDEVIRTLEAWLGVRHAGTFSPQEEQISKLEGYVLAFNTAPAAVLRGRLLGGFFALSCLSAVLLMFFGRLAWASGVVGLAVQFGLAYFVIDGVARKGPLFARVRQFVWGLGWWDWLIAVGSLGLFALLLAMTGVLWHWAGFGAVAVGLAFGVRFSLDRKVDEERRGPLEACEKLLRRLRAQGLDEENLRLFVAKFAGQHWEEFFEALFGFEAKLSARALLLRGGAAGPREKFAAWREPLLGAIDRVESARKAARERKLLAAVERARLLAEGAAQDEADWQAKATAEAMLYEANRLRQAEANRVAQPVGVAQLVSGVSHSEFAFEPTSRPDPIGWLVRLFVGSHVRVLLAAALLTACGVWAHQNGLIPGAEAQAKLQAAVESQDLSGLEQAAPLDQSRVTTPLRVEGVPEPLTAWADSFNVGLAGLLLLVSLLFRGNQMSVLVLLGAGVAVAGHHLGIRTVEPVSAHHVALALGSVITLVGYRTGMR
jgi:hypothetical protein